MKLLPISVGLMALLAFGCDTNNQPQGVFQPVPPADTGLAGVHPHVPDEPAASTPSPDTTQQAQEEAKKEAAREAKKREKEAEERQPKTIISPDTGLHGKVSSFNEEGRFVVLTLPLGQMPQPDTELFIYRNNMKVGEVKITGPQRDNNIVADLVNGEAQSGDEVRDK